MTQLSSPILDTLADFEVLKNCGFSFLLQLPMALLESIRPKQYPMVVDADCSRSFFAQLVPRLFARPFLHGVSRGWCADVGRLAGLGPAGLILASAS